MDTNAFNPPADIAEDFRALQSTQFDDPSDDRLRRLLDYFDSCEMKAMQMRIQSADFEQKELAGMLADAFAAAKRIVQVASEKAASGVPAS